MQIDIFMGEGESEEKGETDPNNLRTKTGNY
jgi:hypothetical protein